MSENLESQIVKLVWLLDNQDALQEQTVQISSNNIFKYGKGES